MLKKLRKTLSKEFKKRYDKLESNYLGLENRIYTTIEDRLSTLEDKFEDLSELIREEIRSRKERNEDKLEEMDQEDHYDEDGGMLSEKLDDVKDAVEAKIKEAKKTVSKNKDKVAKQVDKAKDFVNKKIKKGKKVVKAKKKIVEEAVEDVVETVKDAVEDLTDSEVTTNDLTAINGLGAKFAARLAEEGIVSYKQLATLTEQELAEIDAKIKSFAARYERYDWRKQAEALIGA